MATPTPVLTTLFLPPASCTNVVTYDGSYLWQGELFETGDLNCYPASYSFARNKFFSPGVCPDGWYSASSVSGTGALVYISTESNALCCPTGYQAIEPSNGPDTTGNTIFCGSVVDSLLTNVYSTSTLDIGPLPDVYTTSTLDVAALGIRPTVWAELIQVRWQATDTVILSLQAEQASSLSSASTASAASSASSAPSAASTSAASSPTSLSTQATAPAPSTTAPAPNDSGLSTGAKAGIGIGAAALAVMIIFGAFFLFRRRKKPGFQHSNIPLVPPHYDEQKTYPQVTGATELDGRYNQTIAEPYPHRQYYGSAELSG